MINATYGNKIGDLSIKKSSQQLDPVVMHKGILARLGGDEFRVLFEGDNAQITYSLANKLLSAVQEFRFVWANRVFTLGINIGQVLWQPNISNP